MDINLRIGGRSCRTYKAGQARLEARENDPHPRGITFGFHGAGITQIDADCKKKEKRYKARAFGGTSRGQKSDVRGQEGKQRFQARMVGGKVSEDLFERGLCLPSGTAMTDGDLDRVIETILNCKK
jgi:hypothetical protein